MKQNAEAIHFYIKSRGVQGLFFTQITFEKYTKKFYFENGQGYKKAIKRQLLIYSLYYHGMFRLVSAF